MDYGNKEERENKEKKKGRDEMRSVDRKRRSRGEWRTEQLFFFFSTFHFSTSHAFPRKFDTLLHLLRESLSNIDVISYIRKALEKIPAPWKKENLDAVANQLVKFAVKKGSTDNITCLIAAL